MDGLDEAIADCLRWIFSIEKEHCQSDYALVAG